MTDNINSLEQKIKIIFKNKKLLTEALTHRSYLNENGNSKNIHNHNERLEFLGDAVLELVVTEFLYDRYKDFSEGTLTSLRSALVKTESLAFEASRINLGEHIFMSKGEEQTGGRTRPYILANSLEALIGAIYLDRGYQEAFEFIKRYICYKIEDIIKQRLDIDSKTKFQEIAQESTKITPFYDLLNSSGPDHNKTFEMGVYLNNFLFGKGYGKSKQEAEQNAATEALKNWEKLFPEFKKKYTDDNSI